VIPHAPLGLITTAVQALAGVLLPSATVFLLLLCNDTAVLGPWINKTWLNVVASVIVGVLVILSLILAATTLFPTWDVGLLTTVLAVALALALGLGLTGLLHLRRRRSAVHPAAGAPAQDRMTWRMPPLAELPRPVWSTARKVAMLTLRLYLVVAAVLLAARVVQLALGH